MPALIKMRITNGNNNYNIPKPPNVSTQNNITKGPGTLKSNMIGRIHNIQPGCGGCGRH